MEIYSILIMSYVLKCYPDCLNDTFQLQNYKTTQGGESRHWRYFFALNSWNQDKLRLAVSLTRNSIY